MTATQMSRCFRKDSDFINSVRADITELFARVNCKLKFRAQRRLGRAPLFLEIRLSAESATF
jgi:hypothetical protein